MHYLLPVLVLASPAAAHQADLPHAHSADWGFFVALLVLGVVAVAALIHTRRART